MKPTDFLPLGRFLAKAWSSDTNTQLRVMKNSVAEADIRRKIIQVDLPNKYSRKVKIGYRLWRTTIFHESMHIRFTPSFVKNETDLHNIVEDYRIEELGKKLFKGMKKELKFLHMVYAGRHRRMENSHSAYTKTILEFYSRLSDSIPLFDCFKGERRFDDAVKFAKEYLDRVNYSWNSQEEIDLLIKELCKILGIEYTSNTQGYPEPENTQNVTDSEIEKAVEWLSERLDSLESEAELIESEENEEKAKEVSSLLEAVESIEPSEEVLAELEKVKEEAKKIDALHTKDEECIKLSGVAGYEDPERFTDYGTVSRLVRVFKELKFRLEEVYSSTGSEFDVESFLAKSKPFITDTRKSPGNIVVLIDMSSSISSVDTVYKSYLVNIGFALKQVGIPFSVYVFGGYDITNIKSIYEPFTKEVAGRLCSVRPLGVTPIGTVYKSLRSVIKRCKLLITITDGEPTPSYEIFLTKNYNTEFQDSGVVSVAITFAEKQDTDYLEYKLNKFKRVLGYDDVVMVKSFTELPKAFAKVLARWHA